MISNIRKTRTEDRGLQVVQDSVFQCLETIRRKEILDGRRIKDVYVDSSTPTEVAHGLGRPLIGWLVISKNANANLWQTTSDEESILTLNTSADVTVSLWVF